MKRILTLLVFAFGSTQAIAQQDPQFTQYMQNKLFMNPAYAGMKKAICVSAIYRNQWNGFDGAPNSGVFSADMSLRRNGGVGLNIMYDKLGFENSISFRGCYAYHINLPRGARLGVGIDIGGFSKRVGPSGSQQWLASSNWQADGFIPPLLKKTVFDVGLGLWFQNERIWAGISTSHLNGSTIDDGTAALNSTTHSLVYQVARHYFITGGVNLKPTPSWTIKPSFLVKTDATITTFDLTALAVYDNRFWFGASYRMQDAICPMIGFIVPGTSIASEDLGLKVGFSYDYNTSKLSNYNNGTFELFVNYCVPLEWKEGGGGDVRIFN